MKLYELIEHLRQGNQLSEVIWSSEWYEQVPATESQFRFVDLDDRRRGPAIDPRKVGFVVIEPPDL